MSVDVRKIVEEEKKEFEEQGLLYCPNSIYHGSLLKGMSKERKVNSQVERMENFLDYLFNHSEHCDHIMQSEAWKEFEEWEVRYLITTNTEINEDATPQPN